MDGRPVNQSSFATWADEECVPDITGFTWLYCTSCDSLSLICPSFGNSTCNGGGCDKCALAFAVKRGSHPWCKFDLLPESIPVTKLDPFKGLLEEAAISNKAESRLDARELDRRYVPAPQARDANNASEMTTTKH